MPAGRRPVRANSLVIMTALTLPLSPGFRVAGANDIDAIVQTITSAFLRDPLWSPVFADHETPGVPASALWRLYVSSAALRFPWTLITDNAEAAAVWYPPGAEALTEVELAGYDAFLEGIVGRTRADEVLEMDEAFDAAHPTEPCFYLSLLATHDDHRGRGLGMALLRESLMHIDSVGMPAYLESSNTANDERYKSVGFEPRGIVTVPSGGQFTSMWRPARGAN